VNIDFELYKVFYFVAKDLSFSEAAAKLFISQSAVSQAIKQLEEKLECKLFNRNPKQVRLTPEGEILYKHVEQAYYFLKTGERSISNIHNLKQGEIRIGATDTICKYYLLPYFKQFMELYPNIKIHVTNRPSPACIELARKGIVDLSVINLPANEQLPHLTVKRIKTLHDVFIAGKNFTALANRKVSLKELAEYPLLLLEKNTHTRHFFEMFTKQNGVNLTPEIELSSVDLLIELTKIGLGISFVVREFIGQELHNNEIFVLDLQEQIPERYLGIVTNDNIPLPIAAQKFIDLLQ